MDHAKHVHFIGIGGSGMSGIAEVLLNHGYAVSGSDLVPNSTTQRLQQLGARVFYGHKADQINGADVVVISAAIQAENQELMAARAAEIPVLYRAQMLAELMQSRYGVAVAGTHGKTTTTSLVASLFAEGGLDPTFVIGGLLKSAGTNARMGAGKYFVAEADESDASFLWLHPKIAIVTNIDADHLSNYQDDFLQLQRGFVDFLHRLPEDGLAVLCADDPVLMSLLPKIKRPIVTYGFAENADYRIIHFRQEGLVSHFTILQQENRQQITVSLNLPGRHNALNATAAYIVARQVGVDHAAIQRALTQFAGVGRRFQIYGELKIGKGQALVIDDYGHHPREISVTLQAIRAAWPERRLVVAYQPHRYTRTAALFDDFVQVLSQVDALALVDIYSAGEAPIANADGATLYQAIGTYNGRRKFETVFVKNIEKLPEMLSKLVRDGDVLLLQGAGSIGTVAAKLAELQLQDILV